MVRVPPNTVLLIGQEMNTGLGSINTTSILLLLHLRMYFAAVAPPKPPPTITTRCPVFLMSSLEANTSPGNDITAIPAAPTFKKSRRLNDIIDRKSGVEG